MSPAPPSRHRARVVGIGNPDRGDDGAGPAVLRRLAELGADRLADLVELEDPARLVEAAEGVDLLLVVDALVTDLPPGTIREPEPEELAGTPRPPSTHGLGVHEALALVEILVPRPGRRIGIMAIAIGGIPRVGAGLSDPVRDAIPVAAARILGRLELYTRGPGPYGTGTTRGTSRSGPGEGVEGTIEP